MSKDKSSLFVEPACEHNVRDKKYCTIPKPGEGSNGCAFEASHAALRSIANVAHLVHGTAGCLENSYARLEYAASGAHFSYYGFSTDLTEQDIVMGGEKKLLQAIEYIAANYQPSAIFVYATCVTILMLENMESICSEAEQHWGIPIILVDSPGLNGSKNLGNRLAGDAIIERIIGTAEPDQDKPSTYSINLIGDHNMTTEIRDIESLVSKAGIRVIAKIGCESKLDDIRISHRADVNVVVCGRSMITLARKMKESYGIPYFEGSFYGTTEIRFSFRQLAFHLQIPELEAKIHKLMRREEERLRKDIAPFQKALRGKKVVLYTDAIESWAFIFMLQDLGLKITAIGTNKNTQEDLSRIRERLSEDTVLILNCDESQIIKVFRQNKADMMIVSSRNSFIPLKERIPFLDFDQEQHSAYAGYTGMRRFAQDVLEILEQPVWKEIKRKAPWEGDGDG